MPATIWWFSGSDARHKNINVTIVVLTSLMLAGTALRTVLLVPKILLSATNVIWFSAFAMITIVMLAEMIIALSEDNIATWIDQLFWTLRLVAVTLAGLAQLVMFKTLPHVVRILSLPVITGVQIALCFFALFAGITGNIIQSITDFGSVDITLTDSQLILAWIAYVANTVWILLMAIISLFISFAVLKFIVTLRAVPLPHKLAFAATLFLFVACTCIYFTLFSLPFTNQSNFTRTVWFPLYQFTNDFAAYGSIISALLSIEIAVRSHRASELRRSTADSSIPITSFDTGSEQREEDFLDTK
eukprot:jgi/Hompol1/4782/HPOL_003914-RA